MPMSRRVCRQAAAAGPLYHLDDLSSLARRALPRLNVGELRDAEKLPAVNAKSMQSARVKRCRKARMPARRPGLVAAGRGHGIAVIGKHSRETDRFAHLTTQFSFMLGPYTFSSSNCKTFLGHPKLFIPQSAASRLPYSANGIVRVRR